MIESDSYYHSYTAMTDIERMGSKEQKLDVITDAVEGDYSPEYHEYLRLQETFTGKALNRLHVSHPSQYASCSVTTSSPVAGVLKCKPECGSDSSQLLTRSANATGMSSLRSSSSTA